VFIFITVCMLADPASRDLLHQRLRGSPLPAFHALTATGWSHSYRAGYLPPTGSLRPFHGALKPWAEFCRPFGFGACPSGLTMMALNTY
jgi:hypothetical protein